MEASGAEDNDRDSGSLLGVCSPGARPSGAAASLVER